MSVSAGWYQDPQSPDHVRWWDGTRWTGHQSPKEGTGVPAPTQGAEQVRDSHISQRAEEAEKISFFGARGKARDLAAENDRLRAELRRLDGLSLFEIREQCDQGARDLEKLREQGRIEIERAQAEAARILEKAARDKRKCEAKVLDLRRQLDELERQYINVRTDIDVQEVGLYDYENPAESSAALAHQLVDVRLKAKQLVQAGAAVAGFRWIYVQQLSRQGPRVRESYV